MMESASIPSGPVPTLPPSASVGMLCGQGEITENSASPRTQCGTDGVDCVHVREPQPLHFAQCPGDGCPVAGRSRGSRSDLGRERLDQLVGGRVGERSLAQGGRGVEVRAREGIVAFDAALAAPTSDSREARISG